MTASRFVATGVVLAAMGWAAWTLAAGTSVSDTSAAGSASAIEERQRDILRSNIGQPGDPALTERFRQVNSVYFAGRLPAIPVRWEPRLGEVGALAGRSFTLEGMFGHVNGRPVILLHPNLAGDTEAIDRALCHEVVHAHLWTTGEPSTKHGEAFQRELERLAAAGAFTGIVASQADRDNLRAWIDSERARLDSYADIERRDADRIEQERQELERTIAEVQARIAGGSTSPGRPDAREIDAINARREAYNRRVMEASARAERGRTDAAELNRQIERYNLMQSYPDGMDEETTAPATAPPVTH